jgi:hypothetical protein
VAVTASWGVSTSRVDVQLVPTFVAAIKSADVDAVIVPPPVMLPTVEVRSTVSADTESWTTRVGAFTEYEVPAELDVEKVPQLVQSCRVTVEALSDTFTEVPALSVKPRALMGALAPVEMEPKATSTAADAEDETPAIAADDPEVVMLPFVAFKKNVPELATVEPETVTKLSASAM